MSTKARQLCQRKQLQRLSTPSRMFARIFTSHCRAEIWPQRGDRSLCLQEGENRQPHTHTSVCSDGKGLQKAVEAALVLKWARSTIREPSPPVCQGPWLKTRRLKPGVWGELFQILCFTDLGLGMPQDRTSQLIVGIFKLVAKGFDNSTCWQIASAALTHSNHAPMASADT